MSDDSDIAVVGLAGRFPGAANVRAFWDNLRSGTESIRFFSRDELRESGVALELIDHPRYVPAAPVLDDIAAFDAEFFGYPAREAAAMDPQQRIFLQCCWHALEHAGYDPMNVDGRVGVFGSSAMNTYLLFSGLIHDFQHDYLPTLIGNDKDFLATRVAFKLGLRGPAMSIQTACSSSLVAIHTACQTLLSDEADLAIAGGVAVRVPHVAGHLYEAGNVLSRDGHVRPFDSAASGTIFGSGAGVVALKRRADAEADGDTIHALIKGSAVNNDGSSKVGYTAPSVGAQADVISEALGVSGVSADTIGYVEAHGTGTHLGDPIEVAALTRAFASDTDRRGFCWLSSVKGNIGHLDAAAGVAGFIKTVEILSRGEIPPTLHYKDANPEIDFANSPFKVVSELTPWPCDGDAPRRAGITSLGIGGTNAHVILEQAEEVAVPEEDPASDHLLFLSARTQQALDRAQQQLGEHLKDREQYLTGPELQGEHLKDRNDWPSISHTLLRGRHPFPRRSVAVVSGDGRGRNLPGPNDWRKEIAAPGRRAVFLFSGQGAQFPGMGRDLYASGGTYSDAIDLCAETLSDLLELDLRGLLSAEPGDEAAAAALRDTRLTQPALFCVSYALARQWASVGVTPVGMAGHSIGEFAAAVLSGVFSLEDALSLVALRGKLMSDLPGGDMLAVALPESELAPLLDGELDVAAINQAGQTVVAGEAKAVADLSARLEERGTTATLLTTSHAFHSRMMDPILGEFEAAVGRVELREPQIPFTSCVSGSWIGAEEATDPRYWARHIRQAVRFDDCLRTVLDAETKPALIELGPGHTLAAFARRHPGREGAPVFASLPSATDRASDTSRWLESAGRFWAAGGELDWEALVPQARRVPLPQYAFEPTPHWYEGGQESRAQGRDTRSTHPLSRFEDPADWFYTRCWLSAPPLPVSPRDRAEASWLALEIGGKARGAVLGELRERGVEPGSVAAGSREALSEGIREAAEAGKALRIVLFVGRSSVTRPLAESVRASHEEIFAPLFDLGAVLATRRPVREVEVVAVLDPCQRVTASEELAPELAIALGPLRTFTRELESVRVRVIDAASDVPPDRLADEIISGERFPAVALRGETRWLSALVPTPAAQPTVPAFREGAAYLVTGGLGGVGRKLVGFLTETCGAQVVAMGRSATPSEAVGFSDGQVEVFAGDVTRPEDVEAALVHTRERFGAVAGIIHAAGSFASGIMAGERDEASTSLLAPKTIGTANLLEAARRHDVPRLWMISSTAALLSPPGTAAYSAANCVLDAISEFAAGETSGPRVSSIAFPAWRHVGMADRLDESAENQELLLRGLEPEEAIEAFARGGSADTPNVLVSPVDLRALEREAREGESFGVRSGPAELSLPLDPEASLADHICQIWQQTLGGSGIEVDDDWVELGGTSYLAVRVFSRIEEHFGIALPIDTLVEARTPRALAEVLEGAGVEAVSSEAPKPSVAASCLVTLREGGSRPPLFIAHAHLGTVLGQVNLARALREDRPVYGFRSVALDGVSTPDESIGEMADRYLRELTQRYPEGPLHLFGWCLGGTICLEMAQRLRESGRAPGLLIAAQPPAHGFPRYSGPGAGAKGLASKLLVLAGRELRRLRASDRTASIARIKHLARELRRRVFAPEADPGAGGDPRLQVPRANEEAFQTYRPARYPGSLVLIRSLREPLFADPDPGIGWGDLAGGELILRDLDTYRDLMLESPWVSDLARLIDDELDRYESSGS